MKNREFIKMWVSNPHIKGKANNLAASGGRLYTYNTCLCEIASDDMSGNFFIVNMTRYSVTSSKHRTYLLRELSGENYLIVNDVPEGSQGLDKFLD